MVENESFIRKELDKSTNSVIIIDDSNYKSSRSSNVSFSTNYLKLSEQVALIISKNKLTYFRNMKILIFILLSPIFFLGVLQLIQNLSEYYHETIKNKEPEIVDLDSVSLKCGWHNCTSIGISLIGDYETIDYNQTEFIIDSISNQTQLLRDLDIKIISNRTIDDLYTYLESNPNTIQYAIIICYTNFEFNKYFNIPCKSDIVNMEFNFYTLVYNISSAPNGFLDSFNEPLPKDLKLTKLKLVVDNSYLSYFSKKYIKETPKISLSLQNFPSASSRLNKNADVISLFGVFYLYFPSMIIFTIFMNDLVKEKENFLKVYLNLNGLSYSGYWLSWFITALIISFIIGLEIIFLGYYIFSYNMFTNCNPVVMFSLFFFFTLNMQVFSMFLSCIISSTRVANTISYGIILVGLVLQVFFINHSLIYIFYAEDTNYLSIINVARFLFHFYPPFIFSKCYTDLTRISSFHFDGPSLQWIPGRYFNLYDIFSEAKGVMRIGIKYHVHSYFYTCSWFILLIFFYLGLITLLELNASIKGGSIISFRNLIRVIKEVFKNMNLKKMNVKRQLLETMINKNYTKYLKLEENSENNSIILNEDHQTVIIEKKLVANLNKKRTVPSGIRVMSLSKQYDNGVTALSDINLEITKGEVLAILGPNGAGKSTLINILTNQISSSSGYAKIGPFMIHNDMFIDALYVKRLIGICSQYDYLFDELTVYETMHLYSRLRGIGNKKVDEYIETKLNSVNLNEKKFDKISSLSGGMKRRLSICISTLGEPFIIFMDEPTTGLDPNNRRKIWKLINKLKKDRVIIISTHILEEAEYLSDRLAIVVGGKLRFIGNCSELRATYWDGIILIITIDLNKLGDKFFLLDDNIKFLFIYCKIKYSISGIYNILIGKNQTKEVLRAFDLFNKKKEDNRIYNILEYTKDVSISQSKLENIYLEFCKM